MTVIITENPPTLVCSHCMSVDTIELTMWDLWADYKVSLGVTTTRSGVKTTDPLQPYIHIDKPNNVCSDNTDDDGFMYRCTACSTELDIPKEVAQI